MLVNYLPAEMYALVDDVERYPEFLPWCGGAEVEQRDDRVTRATLRIDFKGVRQSFSTENRKEFPYRMDIQLVSGPFRALSGGWRFTALGNRGCKVEFSLSYEFSSGLLEAVIGPVFEHISGTLVDAFVKRAEKIHGERT